MSTNPILELVFNSIVAITIAGTILFLLEKYFQKPSKSVKTFHVPSNERISSEVHQNDTMRISQLWVYPVKSCRGISLQKATLGKRGIQYDREFMVIHSDSGNFVTQRQYPQMCLIDTALSETELTLSFSDHFQGSICIPLALPYHHSIRKVTVWGDTGIDAFDMGDACALWISYILDKRVRHQYKENVAIQKDSLCFRIVRISPTFRRNVPHPFLSDLEEETGFADMFPYLLTSAESLSQVNSWCETNFSMDRFRPNIVVSNTNCAFSEDWWRNISLGSQHFRACRPCSRCVIPCIDQSTSELGKEPSKTLRKYRCIKDTVYFGQHLVCSSFNSNSNGSKGFNSINVGDPVMVLDLKESCLPL